MDLYNTVEDKVAKNTLVFLADEERKHRACLIKYRDGVYPENAMTVSEETTAKIKEFSGKPKIKKTSTTKDIFLVAADRELSAYNFYKKLADIHPSGEVRDLLLRMAQE